MSDIIKEGVKEIAGPVGKATAETIKAGGAIVVICVAALVMLTLAGYGGWVLLTKTSDDAKAHSAELVVLFNKQIDNQEKQSAKALEQQASYQTQMAATMQSLAVMCATVPDEHRRQEERLSELIVQQRMDREEAEKRQAALLEKIAANTAGLQENTAALLALAKNGGGSTQ